MRFSVDCIVLAFFSAVRHHSTVPGKTHCPWPSKAGRPLQPPAQLFEMQIVIFNQLLKRACRHLVASHEELVLG